MISQGILHQSSCAHTPQQNGVAERKNRHLIDTARTLLLHTHVPQCFWRDAVLTACYLINRMSSSVLQNQVPHSLLFPNQTLYSLPPRVFGCTCFVHDLTPGKDKLHAKSLKCIFLGYSRLQKGYKCFSPDLKRYLVSPDVTFFKSTLFFLSLGYATGSSVTNDLSLSSTGFIPQVVSSADPVVDTEDSTPPLLTYHCRPQPEPVQNPTITPSATELAENLTLIPPIVEPAKTHTTNCQRVYPDL